VDSAEHLVEDISSSSDKELWELVKRKRPCPARGNGNGEGSVEHEGPPPTKKPAMAEAVATALNKGFEMQRKGKEKKTDTPMEAPQNPTKWPKIHTEAFTTPKGKSQPRSGEVGEGSKDTLTKSKFDLEIPKDILK